MIRKTGGVRNLKKGDRVICEGFVIEKKGMFIEYTEAGHAKILIDPPPGYEDTETIWTLRPELLRKEN